MKQNNFLINIARLVWVSETTQCATITHRTPVPCIFYSSLNLSYYVKFKVNHRSVRHVNKFVHINHHDSLVPYMRDFCLGYDHLCGTPIAEGKYLMTDVSLAGITPDVLFERTRKAHGRTYTDRYYGYLMEDMQPKNLFEK